MIAGAALFSVATSSASPALRVGARNRGARPRRGLRAAQQVPDGQREHCSQNDRRADAYTGADHRLPDVDEREHEQQQKQNRAHPVAAAARCAWRARATSAAAPCPARAAAIGPGTPGAQVRGGRSIALAGIVLLNAAIHNGIDTIARWPAQICNAGANDRCPPAPSERRSATGAPGAMAISIMPISAARGRSTDARDDPRRCRNRDQHREQRLRAASAVPADDPAEFADDDGEADVEHTTATAWRRPRPKAANRARCRRAASTIDPSRR